MKNPSPAPGILRIFIAFIYVYTSIVLIIFFWTAYNSIRFPFGQDYGEAPLIDQARKVINGEELYKLDVNSPPYTITNYPPLYPSLVALTSSIFTTPLFQTGRALSIIFSIISGIIIGLILFSLTNNKILAAFAVMLFLGNPYVIVWSSLARVDLIALAFSLLGLYTVYKGKESIGWLITACLFFLISIFTRQTYILAGPLASFVYLFSTNIRRSFLFLAVLLGMAALTFGMIYASTQGGFYNHIVTANINEYDITRTLNWFKQFFILLPVVIVISIIRLVSTLRSRRSHISPGSMEVSDGAFLKTGLSVYLAGAAVSALTIGKIGSNVNYFLEVMAAFSVWTAIAFYYIQNQSRNRQWIFTGLMIFQMIWILSVSISIINGMLGSTWRKTDFYQGLSVRIRNATKEGVVLSDDYMDLVVLAGQEVYYQPFEYGQLYAAGLWDPTDLANQINRKEFPLIVIGGDTVHKECCWPEPLADALDKSYQQEMDSGVIILTPRE